MSHHDLHHERRLAPRSRKQGVGHEARILVRRDALIIRDLEVRDRRVVAAIEPFGPNERGTQITDLITRGVCLDRDGWLAAQFATCSLLLHASGAAVDRLYDEAVSDTADPLLDAHVRRLASLRDDLDYRIEELQSALRHLTSWGYPE